MGRYPNSTVQLTQADVAAAFQGVWGDRFPPVLTVEQAALLLQVSPWAIYRMVCKGGLDGTFTKVAGKLRFFRDQLYQKTAKGGIDHAREDTEETTHSE
jgi:hypothetical protein